jgi:hypothetical protein
MCRLNVVVTVVVLTGFVSILAGHAPAQPTQGDLVVTSDHKGSFTGAGVFYVTWPSSTLRTLHGGLTVNAVKTAYGNARAMVIGTNTGTLYYVDAAGAYTTITSKLPAGGAGVELDQDAYSMVINFDDSRMYRVTQSGGVSTFLTFTATHGRPNAICRDGDSGDWVVGTSNGLLLKVDRVTAAISTMASGLGAIYDAEFMDQTGEFAVIREAGLAIVRRSGSVHYSRSISYANAVAVDHKSGRIYVATYLNHQILELTSTATIVRNRIYSTPVDLQFTGIDVWDDQNVSTIAHGDRGSKVTIVLRFETSRGRPYAVALSLAQRPGIAFSAGNVLNMRLDTLFLLTAGGALPYWTSGFAGTINTSNGLGYAYFTIPWNLSPGSCLYAGAAAVNPSAPNNLDVGNVMAIQVK